MLERYGDDHPAASWPVQDSMEYYQLLRNQDGARLAAAASGSRRHLLSTTSNTTAYTSVEGNETESYADQENLVQILELEVGNRRIAAGRLNASFDTFVFYTYLPSAIYTEFVDAVSLLLVAAAAAALLILGPQRR
ncbi:unnamed protein product [Sphagnum jensenii]|uniref:Uncharacterized protein n=1 Tax=Sphagnum jensenii TaxID=128206 RepID=A0ABP1ACR3_9BRYO